MPAQSPPAPSEDLLFSSPATSPDSHASSSGSGMSDERNADSVLFKLETVAQMHAAQQQQARQPSPLARLAAPAPASKAGSGLIDIKELAASGNAPAAAAPAAAPQPRPAAEGSGLIDIKKLATAEASSHAASSPSASDHSLLSSSSMLGVMPSPEASTATVPAKAPSRTPLIVLSVLALLALAAAVGAIILRA